MSGFSIKVVHWQSERLGMATNMYRCTFDTWLRLGTGWTAAGLVSVFNAGASSPNSHQPTSATLGHVKFIIACLLSIAVLSATERAHAQMPTSTVIEDTTYRPRDPLENYLSSGQLAAPRQRYEAGSSRQTVAFQKGDHDLARMTTIMQPIAVFGADDRRTEDAYARESGMSVAEVQKRYAANGRLICDKLTSNANLALVNDLIVTSAHAFFQSEHCKKRSTPKNCSFEVRVGNSLRKTKVKSIESIGFTCGKNSSTRQSVDDDWAVLRLEDDLNGIVPFSISNGEGLKNDRQGNFER
jgi:hypothetical protein